MAEQESVIASIRYAKSPPPMIISVSASEGAASVQVVAEGSGKWLVTIWVVLEHSLVLAALLLWLAIPDVPASVQEAKGRVQFEQHRDAESKRHAARLKVAGETRAARDFVQLSQTPVKPES